MRVQEIVRYDTYAHGRDDFGENEANKPDSRHYNNPNAPSENSVAVCVAALTHDTAVDEFGADVCVDDSNDQSRNDDESKRCLLVNICPERTEGRRRRVLATARVLMLLWPLKPHTKLTDNGSQWLEAR